MHISRNLPTSSKKQTKQLVLELVDKLFIDEHMESVSEARQHEKDDALAATQTVEIEIDPTAQSTLSIQQSKL